MGIMISPQEDIDHCISVLRKSAPDLFLLSLFVPVPRRDLAQALFAFHVEISNAIRVVSEPMLGEIRLQWWADALSVLGSEEMPKQPVLRVLHSLPERAELHVDVLQNYIECRRAELQLDMLQTSHTVSLHMRNSMGAIFGLINKNVAGQELYQTSGQALGLVHYLMRPPYEMSMGKEEKASASDITNEVDRLMDALRGDEAVRKRENLLPFMAATLTATHHRKMRREASMEESWKIAPVPVYRRQIALLKARIIRRIPA